MLVVAGSVAMITAAASALVNVLQNDLVIVPGATTKTKKAFVDAWRRAPPPSVDEYRGQVFEGRLVFRGAAAPFSSFVTHGLFAPLRSTWLGKAFAADGASGENLFFKRREIVRTRPFEARLGPSALDLKKALVLEYSDPIWGKVVGMRDELRELRPGVLLGLGSMRATGGPKNCAPFVLVAVPSSFSSDERRTLTSESVDALLSTSC